MTNNIEELLMRFRWQIAFLLVGLILTAAGVFLSLPRTDTAIVIEESSTETSNTKELIVEVAGAVNKPGVYKFVSGSRVEDALTRAEGYTDNTDHEWVEKYINRAAPLSDGQKIYIPEMGEQPAAVSANNQGGDQTGSQVLSDQTAQIVNINVSSMAELDKLRGIGPVTAQKIIDNRPYSSVEELLSRKILTQRVYDENKNYLSTF